MRVITQDFSEKDAGAAVAERERMPVAEGGSTAAAVDAAADEVTSRLGVALGDELVADTFDEMELPEALLRGVYAHGWERPSAIQRRAIMPMRTRRDLIAQAQSGTGKTGAFTIGFLGRVDTAVAVTQALVLAPTRELALQIADVVESVGCAMVGLVVHALVGGTPVRDDMSSLRARVPHVVVGCPGRVNHMLDVRALSLDHLAVLVVDEADEMLSLGFGDQLDAVVRVMPRDAKIAMFSATLPPAALDLAERMLRTPMRITLRADEVTLEGIRQFFVALERDSWKADTLLDLFGAISVQQCVIFANTRRRVEALAETLRRADHTVSVLHGEMPFAERRAIVREFRSGSSRVLVATDIVARGLDVQTVSLVLNFDMPRNRESYIHRIGRGGRYGRRGLAINFVTEADTAAVRELEAYYATVIEPLPARLEHLEL